MNKFGQVQSKHFGHGNNPAVFAPNTKVIFPTVILLPFFLGGAVHYTEGARREFQATAQMALSRNKTGRSLQMRSH